MCLYSTKICLFCQCQSCFLPHFFGWLLQLRILVCSKVVLAKRKRLLLLQKSSSSLLLFPNDTLPYFFWNATTVITLTVPTVLQILFDKIRPPSFCFQNIINLSFPKSHFSRPKQDKNIGWIWWLETPCPIVRELHHFIVFSLKGSWKKMLGKRERERGNKGKKRWHIFFCAKMNAFSREKKIDHHRYIV